MDEEKEKEEGDAQYEIEREEARKRDEERTEKKRREREKAKARKMKGKGGVKAGSSEGKEGASARDAVKLKPNVPAGQTDGGEEGAEGVRNEEEIGIVIHDDD